MSAGLLRDRVVFEKRSTQPDGAGNFESVWGSPVSVAARIRCRDGGEGVLAQRLAGRQPVEITVRSMAATRAVAADWRARDERRGTVFNITSIAPDERGAFIRFLAVAGEADG